MKRIVALFNVVLYFFLQILLAVLLTMIFKLFDNSISLNDLIFKDVRFLGIINIVSLTIIYLINSQYLSIKLRVAFKNLNKSIKDGLIGYFILMIILIVFGVILEVLNLKPASAQNEEMVQLMINNSNIVFSILIIGIITPFLEEIIFRVSIMGLLTRDEKSNNVLLYILSAIIFTLIHDQSIFTDFSINAVVTFITYLLPSLVLAFVYRATNHNLVSVFIVHLLNNTIPLLLIGMV